MSIVIDGENGGTSPLEREIITWYWCRITDWKGGRDNWNDMDHRIVAHLLMRGMLKITGIAQTADGRSYGTLGAVREAIEPYMRALAAVPLPVQQWVVP